MTVTKTKMDYFGFYYECPLEDSIQGLERGEICLIKGIKLEGTVDSSKNTGMATGLGDAFCKQMEQRWMFAGCLVSTEKGFERYETFQTHRCVLSRLSNRDTT